MWKEVKVGYLYFEHKIICVPAFVSLSKINYHSLINFDFNKRFKYVGGSCRWMSICDLTIALFVNASALSLLWLPMCADTRPRLTLVHQYIHRRAIKLWLPSSIKMILPKSKTTERAQLMLEYLMRPCIEFQNIA